MLLLLGARSTREDTSHVPKIRVQGTPPSDTLDALVRCSLNDASFADVKLTVRGEDGAARHIYCHRLILGLMCEYFRNMFLGTFAESGPKTQLELELGDGDDSDDDFRSNLPGMGGSGAGAGGNAGVASGGLQAVHVPDWASYDAVMAVMLYLYVGKVDGGEKERFQPPTSASCAVVIQVLQLSDMWMLPHLKQWCEKYLGSMAVVDLHNICGPFVQYTNTEWGSLPFLSPRRTHVPRGGTFVFVWVSDRGRLARRSHTSNEFAIRRSPLPCGNRLVTAGRPLVAGRPAAHGGHGQRPAAEEEVRVHHPEHAGDGDAARAVGAPARPPPGPRPPPHQAHALVK